MGGPEFFQTPMGRKYYEYDFPELVKAINRLAKSFPTEDEIKELVTVLKQINSKLKKISEQ